MAKPKKRGRPSPYRKQMDEALDAYFAAPGVKTLRKIEKYPDGSLKSSAPIERAADFPTFEGFAASVGVSRGTLYNWERSHPSFAEACARAREQQVRVVVENGLSGRYSSSFAQYLLGVLSRSGELTENTNGNGNQARRMTLRVVYEDNEKEGQREEVSEELSEKKERSVNNEA